MSTWVVLLSREAALLAVVTCVGAGVAAFVPVRAVVRWALAPALGLAAGSCLLMTAGWVMPSGRATWLVLLPAMAASIAAAVLHTRRARVEWRPGRAEAVALALVAAAAAVTVTFPLAAEDTTGPIAYEVSDSAYYTLQIEALQHRAAPSETWGPSWDVVNRSGAFEDAHEFVQIGFVALASATGHLLALDGSDVQAPFMLALVVIAALGVFAGVAQWTRDGVVAPVTAGLLVAGPVTLQLVIDGSQAALSGMALVVPLLVMLGLVVTRPRAPVVVVVAFGVLLAGLHTQYPLFVPGLVVAGIGLVLVRRRDLPYRALAAAIGLAVVLSPVAFVRNVDFWTAVAGTPLLEDAGAGAAPVYDLPAVRLPSWLLQTQELYDLGGSWVVWLLAPALMLALLAFGAARVRGPAVLALALTLAGACVVALQAAFGDECSYCVQRSLLLGATPVAALLGLGVAAAAAARGRGTGVLLALGTLAVVAATAGIDLLQRARETAQVPRELRALAADLRGRDGPVFLEGFGQSADGAFAFPLSYVLAREQTAQRLAVSIETNDFERLAYFEGTDPAGEEFTPGYGWVATRLPAVATPRRVVARHGPYALQQRIAPLDATVTSGVAADPPNVDPRGRAWVQGPMTIWIAAADDRPASLVVGLRGRVGSVPQARVLARDGDATELCIRSADVAPLRRITVAVPARQGTTPPPRQRPRRRAVRGLELTALRAVPGDCGNVSPSGAR